MRREKILTVTLNPCLDWALTVEALIPGATNRVLSSRVDAGGKGVNVSRLVRESGLQTHALAISGGATGDRLSDILDAFGVPHTFFPGEGETRVNLKVLDVSGNMTEFNAPGAPAGDAAVLLMQALEAMLPNAAMVVLAGSVPPDLPSDIYAQMIRLAKEHDVPVLLDTSGAYLAAGAEASPYAVKPNRTEFENWMRRPLPTHDEIADAMRTAQQRGISFVTVSLGEEGALFLNGDTMLYAPPLPVRAVCPAAAGDAMVAMFCFGYVHALSFEETARLMTAAGSLTAAQSGTQMASFPDILRAASNVEIRRL